MDAAVFFDNPLKPWATYLCYKQAPKLVKNKTMAKASSNQHRQLIKLKRRPVFAKSAWKSYVSHVKIRNSSAIATKCKECDGLLASFNAQYTAEEREGKITWSKQL